MKKEGAANDRKFHYPTYLLPSKRPTSGPKFCAEPGMHTQNKVVIPGRLSWSFSTDALFARHLVVGGDAMNRHLWMSDSEGKTWRKSIRLPYGDNATSYGATLLQRRDKVNSA